MVYFYLKRCYQCHQLLQGLFYIQFMKNVNIGLFSNPASSCNFLDWNNSLLFSKIKNWACRWHCFSSGEKTIAHNMMSPTHPGETAEFVQGAHLLTNAIKLNICMIYTLNLLIQSLSLVYAIPFLFGLQVI